MENGFYWYFTPGEDPIILHVKEGMVENPKNGKKAAVKVMTGHFEGPLQPTICLEFEELLSDWNVSKDFKASVGSYRRQIHAEHKNGIHTLMVIQKRGPWFESRIYASRDDAFECRLDSKTEDVEKHLSELMELFDANT